MRLVLAALISAIALNAPADPAMQAGDLLIRGGRVIDGSASPARAADVLLRGDRIIAIGEIANEPPAGVTVIDATGKVVTPGFIDTHAHGEPSKTPEFENFLAMGVTTICLGQDGSSTRVGKMDDWIAKAQEAKPGPNIAPFVGHGTVRSEAGVGLSEEPSWEQVGAMRDLVEQAMQKGCFGMTTGLEYQPGSFSRADELAEIARPVAERGGVVMSHMRTEDDDQLTTAILELVEQGRASGARVHVSHIKSVYGKGAARAEEILALLQNARESGVAVTADIYPYTASHTTLGILFPQFALPPNDYKQTLEERRADLADYLDKRIAKRNGPEATLFGTGPDAGKTLAQVAEEKGKPYAEVLIDKGPNGGSAAYFIMDEELQSRLLVDPSINICSDGAPEMRHPRGYGAFARILAQFVREKGLLTLEEAVYKMSGLPAHTIRLDAQQRGLLKEGFAADLLIFDPAKVNDTATFKDPFQLAEGIDVVIVNGVITRQDGKLTGDRAGRVLKFAVHKDTTR